MADREKIIKGMEMCISQYECSPDDCPYYERPRNESGLCWDRLMADALALLKEQPQIVQCKDCKHKEESVSPSWQAWCNRLHCGCDLEWYCADGERK